MTKKIFHSILMASAVTLLLSLSVVTAVLYGQFLKGAVGQLKAELNLAAQGVELSGAAYLDSLPRDHYRITLIGQDGTVLYDTETDAAAMDNHLGREEIKEAVESGAGESTRYSDTLMQTMIYCARRLSDGTVLRIAAGVDSVFKLLQGILVPMAAIFLAAVVISSILSRRMAKGIVDPLNTLDLEHPAQNQTYDELSPLLLKISRQHQQIAEQVKQLRRKNDEFEQIIFSMSEGLILLDKKGCILSMNAAARQIFGMDEVPIGHDILMVDRSQEMSSAVQDALDGRRSQFEAEKNGSQYQFVANRIESGGRTIGVVILAFDITDRAFAERNRQEFTANVSHELKTPLQSIIGSAELLENGLVKPEDQARFVGHMKNEAARLVSLINDIIHLSQLDENHGPASEPVDVSQVAKEVSEILAVSAAKRKVSFVLEGESCMVNGVRRYIYEILYNLCDNAIRYNVEGGRVTVCTGKENGNAVICVSDTGIGIAPEHHGRIFERFYRVDKSHSKETGGTGLGLSIVRHAVQYHGGKLELDSAVGRGTVVRITF